MTGRRRAAAAAIAAGLVLAGAGAGAGAGAAEVRAYAFTTGAMPFVAPAARVEVYELDAVAVREFLAAVAGEVVEGEDAAARLRAALASPAGRRALERSGRVAEGRGRAQRLGVQWLPAVVEGDLVVYGVRDVKLALQMIERFRASGGSAVVRRSAVGRSEVRSRFDAAGDGEM